MESSQNYILIWLDHSINASNQYYHSLISQLRNIIYSIFTFTDPDQCVDSLTDIDKEKVFMIISSSFAEQLLSVIQDQTQIDSIYIFPDSPREGQSWPKQWIKVKGIFHEIDELCNHLKRDTRRCDYNMAAISIMHTTDSLGRDSDELDQSFMYSQVLKNILLDMNYDEHSKKAMIDFFRKQYQGIVAQLEFIDEFDRDYDKHTPIWWYTRDCFLYPMLNRALRTQDIEIIINMAFFLRDVHRQLQTIHRETCNNHVPFIVYRGQGIFKNEVEKLKSSKHGLLAFNSFLSTSMNRQVSLLYAESAAQDPDLDGILFEINVNPTNALHSFALVNSISYFGNVEEEILFSMHTVFRIGTMKQLENRILRVELTLTNDDDQQLRILREHIEKEGLGGTGWSLLGDLMIRLGKFDRAEDIYQKIYNSTSNKEPTNVALHLNLGNVKYFKGEYENALLYLETAFELMEQSHNSNHYNLFRVYHDLALVHESMGNYPSALTFNQQALKILQEDVSAKPDSLHTTYHNMGNLYRDMGEYVKALSFYEKALQAGKSYFPVNDPTLSTTYNQMGETYRSLGQYPLAMSFFQKALKIRQKVLPPNHPSLATIYHNTAGAFASMHDYSNALCLYQKALDIEKEVLAPSHPDVASTYNGIAYVYNNLGDHSAALSYCQKALKIQEDVLLPDHPGLATTINNIAFAYQHLKDYTTALLYYQKALDIQQKTLPSNHTDLARTYNNMGGCKLRMEEYISAIGFFEKALHIREESLPPYHPSFALILEPMAIAYSSTGDDPKALSCLMKTLEIIQVIPSSKDEGLVDIYNRIGLTHSKMGNYTSALSFYKKALNITVKILSSNHVRECENRQQIDQQFYSQIRTKQAIIYKNMGRMYRLMKDYSNALVFFEKALEIEQTSVRSDDYELSVTYNNFGDLYLAVKEYSKALPFFEKALEIREKMRPINHSALFTIYSNIGLLYKEIKDYSNALIFFQKALEIGQKMLPANRSELIPLYLHLAGIYKLMHDDDMVLIYRQLLLESGVEIPSGF